MIEQLDLYERPLQGFSWGLWFHGHLPGTHPMEGTCRALRQTTMMMEVGRQEQPKLPPTWAQGAGAELITARGWRAWGRL